MSRIFVGYKIWDEDNPFPQFEEFLSEAEYAAWCMEMNEKHGLTWKIFFENREDAYIGAPWPYQEFDKEIYGEIPYYDSVWLVFPMPLHYTCGCGIYVHPSRRSQKAIHIPDCPYAHGEAK